MMRNEVSTPGGARANIALIEHVPVFVVVEAPVGRVTDSQPILILLKSFPKL